MALFKTLEMENREAGQSRPDRTGYDEFQLKDLVQGDTFQGEIFLTKVYENDYGKSANLYISNDDNKETLKGRVNIKGPAGKVTAWKGSVLYDLIDSLEELESDGDRKEYNVYKIDYGELQGYINQLGIVTVEVISHINDDGDMEWNTARIIGVN